MTFTRKHPRISMKCTAMISHGDGESQLGEIVDLSESGVSVRVAGRLTPPMGVSVLIDPKAVPDPRREGGIPSLRGKVVSARRAGHGKDGEILYRVGIQFRQIPHSVEERLHVMAGSLATVSREATPTNLSDSSQGRELLYQRALAEAGAGKFDAARKAIQAALARDANNKPYRALLHLIQAQGHLTAGDRAAAARDVELGLTQVPGDPALLALKERVAPEAAKQGFLGRLFRR